MKDSSTDRREWGKLTRQRHGLTPVCRNYSREVEKKIALKLVIKKGVNADVLDMVATLNVDEYRPGFCT